MKGYIYLILAFSLLISNTLSLKANDSLLTDVTNLQKIAQRIILYCNHRNHQNPLPTTPYDLFIVCNIEETLQLISKNKKSQKQFSALQHYFQHHWQEIQAAIGQDDCKLFFLVFLTSKAY